MGKARYKRNKAGYFSTLVWDGSYDEYGRKHRVHLRSRISSADLEKKVDDLKAKVEAGTAVRRSGQSLADYSNEWLQTKAIYTRNTQRQYSDILRYYIEPEIGNIRISDLTKMHLQLLIGKNADHPRTCQLIRRTVMQIAESAVDDHYLPEYAIRALKAVQLPRYKRRERRTLTEAEKRAVFSATIKPMHRAFLFLLYFCGLRRGEALAMRKMDFDLSHQEARICHSVEFIGNSSAMKSPKSQNGFRVVPIAPAFAEFLREYLPTVDDLLIHNADGGIMTQSGYRRMWETILREMNRAAGGTEKISVITGLTPHIFRHNLCSELCYQVPAISTKKIAAIMGHDESMVIKIYSHILEEKEDAPAAFERIFSAT